MSPLEAEAHPAARLHTLFPIFTGHYRLCRFGGPERFSARDDISIFKYIAGIALGKPNSVTNSLQFLHSRRAPRRQPAGGGSALLPPLAPRRGARGVIAPADAAPLAERNRLEGLRRIIST